MYMSISLPDSFDSKLCKVQLFRLLSLKIKKQIDEFTPGFVHQARLCRAMTIKGKNRRGGQQYQRTETILQQ